MEHFARDPLEAAIIETAERQWALLKHRHLLALGLGPGAIRHRVGNGRLQRLYPGVYTPGHRAISRNTEFLAAVWWCGGDASLAGESASAFLNWTTEDLEHPPPIHLTTTARKHGRPGLVIHETKRLPASHVLTHHGLLRVTDDARTLVDLADHLSYRQLRQRADKLRVFPASRLQQVHDDLPGRLGHGAVELLIHSEDARTKSELERRYTVYASHHALPQPDERNVKVAGCLVDCVYHAPRVALELDSRAHHQRQAEMLEDRRRDRAYRRAGYTPIRVMWEELEPEDHEVANELRAQLGG